MVYRERREKAAFLDAIIDIVGVMNNLNTDKLFSVVKQKYELELYQEMYDTDMLRAKMFSLREAVDSIKKNKREKGNIMNKLDKLGELYEKDDNSTKPKK